MKKRNLLFSMISVLVIIFSMSSLVLCYQPGSRDDDVQAAINWYQNGESKEVCEGVIHESAINNGASSSVLEQALNAGLCLQYIDLYKANNLIPQDFYPAGTSAPATEQTQTNTTQTSTETTTDKATENKENDKTANNKQEPEKAEPTEEEIAAAWKETERVEATCTEEGVITYTNSITGETKTEPIPMIEHDYAETTRVEATCAETGKATYMCSICKETYEKELPMIEHTEGEWTVVKKAGAFSTGEKILTCSACGEILESEEIPQTCPLSATAVIAIGICSIVVIVGGACLFIRKRKKA